MQKKTSTPKGTRDFLPLEMDRRNYIFETIKNIFNKYGFVEIQTPAMENLSTLLGKYGDEGDKLLFKIVNSGDFLRNATSEDMLSYNKLALKICDKGLRYDLTVPFARFIVQNRDKISFPFRRYQIQPVWRADKPQKGRYREFYQCDADIIGSESLLNEVELIEMLNEVFCKLGINVAIKINSRKILSGIAELIGESDKIVDITVAIDKLDKIGIDSVNEELLSKGLNKEAIDKLQPILNLSGSNVDKLNRLKEILISSEIGRKGIEEIETIFSYLANADIKSTIELDLTLARGLNYYTGAIIEVKSLDTNIGSISGGGRYDNLTGIFGLKDMSGVGISFGADRIYDVMEELNLFPEEASKNTRIIFVAFDSEAFNYILPIIRDIRNKGIPAEIYPNNMKIKKQMQYANDKNIPFVAIVGDDEISSNTVMLKNMITGEQQAIMKDDITKYIS